MSLFRLVSMWRPAQGWTCWVCRERNAPEAPHCKRCGAGS